MTTIHRVSLGATVILLTTAGCSEASAPSHHIGDVIYVVGESHSLFAVDPQTSRVIAQVGPIPEEVISPVLSSDSSTLFFSAFANGAAAIYALDAKTLTLQPRFQLSNEADAPNGSL